MRCDVEIVYRKVRSTARLEDVTQVFSELKGACILGGNEAGCAATRFSVWAAEPVDTFIFADGDDRPFEKLQNDLSKYHLNNRPAEIPAEMFCCGWMGYFSYDLGRYIEKLPKETIDDLSMPLIRLGFYDSAICYDHVEKNWWLIALEMGDGCSEQKLDRLFQLLSESQKAEVVCDVDADMSEIDVDSLACNMDKEFYLQAIEKTQRYIRDGEVYQINFSQRFECDYNAGAIDLYHWQNRHNASPYAAFIDAGDFAIVSASPELFLRIFENKISTKPIKGTIRRVTDGDNIDEQNKANFAALASSEKDQAELNMIIDLERNDLTRVCVNGTIKVTQPRTIEAYPTVFHAVATVEGELVQDWDICKVLKATFPGGSITGAPKIRSMEIIDELEPTARGVYTGSIGYIGVDESVCLNIAIRTVIISGQKAYAQVGGGIVADSINEAEWAETITKARALLAGIKAASKS